MNNSKLYIISGVFAVALLVLYILHFTTRPSAKEMARGNFSTMLNDSTVTLPIAFVNVDSLLMNYHFAHDVSEALMRKEEGIRATLNQRQNAFQNAATEFERRRQNNAFLNQERFDQEVQRLQRMEQEYQQTAERLMGEFQREQMRMNIEMEDSIRVRIAEFNAIRGFEFIFSNAGTGTILHADEKYDITREVTSFLNNRYVPSPATE
jgi:outer membrane protein